MPKKKRFDDMIKAPVTSTLRADLDAMVKAAGHDSVAELVRRYIYLGLADDARQRRDLHDVVQDQAVIGYRDGRKLGFCPGKMVCAIQAQQAAQAAEAEATDAP